MVLPDGEMIFGDKGYRGDPAKIITPVRATSYPMNRQHKLIMARHEHINKYVQDFIACVEFKDMSGSHTF